MEVFVLLMLIVVADGVSIGSHHRRGEHLCRKSHDLLETAINEERKAKQRLLECVDRKKEQKEFNEENFVKRDDYISVQQTLHDEVEARNKLERIVSVLQTQVNEIQRSVTLISGHQKMINELESQNEILKRNLSTALIAIEDLNKKSDECEEKSLNLQLKFDSSEQKTNQLKLDVDATHQKLAELMSLRDEFDAIASKTKRIGKHYKDTCETDISCVEGLICKGNLCGCESLKYWNGSFCVPRKTFGETCQADDHCMEGLNCKNRRCECKESPRYWNGLLCVPRKTFKQICETDINCVEGLNCKNRRCECKESSRYWNGSLCVPRKPYKDTCETDISCVEGLMCRDTLCQCDSLRYWNGLLCVPRKTFKQICETDINCVEGLNCKNRRCECKESSRYWNGSLCVPRKNVNEICQADIHCIEGLVCKNSRCECKESSRYWDGSVCVPNKNVNESCHADIHCLEGLVCKNRRCDCKESLKYWNGSTCVARKTFKQICETDINCVEGLVCLNSRCQCKRSSWSKTLCGSAPTECADLDISEPGVYTIYTADITPYDVYCKIVDGVKWTVFQRRKDGSVDFNRTWIEYKNGFGNINGEFWLGNDFINQLSSNGPHRLHVELTKRGTKYHASYSKFMVDNESKNYRLAVTGYTGNAGDSLNNDRTAQYKHNGMEFSTWDNDNDGWGGGNCAAGLGSGWWYNACYAANLNRHPGRWGYDLEWGTIQSSQMMMTRQ